MPEKPLVMIPGPIEVSPDVCKAYSVKPPSHLASNVIEAFGASLQMMRKVWCAAHDSQPFVIPGSGTLAMDMAVSNLVEPGDNVLVVNTGYFSDRISQMLRRRGAVVKELIAEPGGVPSVESIENVLQKGKFKALYATHVDTSTGVRIHAKSIVQMARSYDALSVIDGVCATAAERFEMANWDADVYLSSSQKAIGLPVGLAMMVVSTRALESRYRLRTPPPMSIDWLEWLPIMKAYQERKPSYFSTPATNLILALDVALKEILASQYNSTQQMEARFLLQEHAADAMRAAWRALGLSLLPAQKEITANTLSAIYYPDNIDTTLLGKIASKGVIVAGGLHPALKTRYFRVGHMGFSITKPSFLFRTIDAIEQALSESGCALIPGNAKKAAAKILSE